MRPSLRPACRISPGKLASKQITQEKLVFMLTEISKAKLLGQLKLAAQKAQEVRERPRPAPPPSQPRRQPKPPETLADQALIRKLLGVRPGLREFKIVYGTLAEADDG